jgi:hypothetical protein
MQRLSEQGSVDRLHGGLAGAHEQDASDDADCQGGQTQNAKHSNPPGVSEPNALFARSQIGCLASRLRGWTATFSLTGFCRHHYA